MNFENQPLHIELQKNYDGGPDSSIDTHCRECHTDKPEEDCLSGVCDCLEPVHRTCLDLTRMKHAVYLLRCRHCAHPYKLSVNREVALLPYPYWLRNTWVPFILGQTCLFLFTVFAWLIDRKGELAKLPLFDDGSAWSVYFAFATMLWITLSTLILLYFVSTPTDECIFWQLRFILRLLLVAIFTALAVGRLPAVHVIAMGWIQLARQHCSFALLANQVKCFPVRGG
jgi:hypothetical protein